MIGVRIAQAATLAFLVYRSFFAIDFSDESAYLAIPLQFAHGAKPFVDEINVMQLAGVLLYPLVKLFLLFSPNQTAILLFARGLFVAAWFATWLGIHKLLRASPGFARGFSDRALGWAALGWLLFIPNNLLGLCYNSFGLLFLALGLAASWRYHRNPGPGGWLVTGFLSFAMWCYPGYVIVLVPYLTGWWWAQKSDRRRWVIPLLAGFIPLTILVLTLVVWIGFSPLLSAVRGFPSQGNAITFSQAWLIFKRVIPAVGPFHYLLLILWSGLIMPALARRKSRFSAYGSVVLAVLVAMSLGCATYFGSIYSGYSVTVRALFLLAMVAVAIPVRSSVVCLGTIWIPCLFCGLIAGMGSTAQERNFGLAATPSLYFLIAWLGQWIEERVIPQLPKASLLQPLVAAVVALRLAAGSLFGGFFYDDAYSNLTYSIKNGPYRFLITTPEKGAYLERVWNTISAKLPDRARVSFYLMPGGLLQKPLRNSAASVWIVCNSKMIPVHLERMTNPDKPSDFVVLFHRIYYTSRDVRTYAQHCSTEIFNKKLDSFFSPFYRDDELIILKRKI